MFGWWWLGWLRLEMVCNEEKVCELHGGDLCVGDLKVFKLFCMGVRCLSAMSAMSADYTPYATETPRFPSVV